MNLSDDMYVLVNHKPVRATNADEWAKQIRGSRRVAESNVNGHWISTVFLTIDHRYNRRGPPILFETMVFCRHADMPSCSLDGEMKRYSTWEAAQKGHEKMVTRVRKETK